MTNTHFLKAHYDIVYKNVIRKSDTSLMDLNCFFDALEEVGQRLLRRKTPYENFKDIIDLIMEQL